MKHVCKICGNEYEYCHSCAITKNVFKNAGYCGENCYRISMILQRYGCKVASSAETIKELQFCNIDEISLQPGIEEYYQEIVSEAKPKRKDKIIEEIVPSEDVEVVINIDGDMSISENE